MKMDKKLKSFRNVDIHFVYEDLVDSEGDDTGEEHICELLVKRNGKTIKIIRPLLYVANLVQGEREPTILEDKDLLTLGVLDKKDDYVIDLEEEKDGGKK